MKDCVFQYATKDGRIFKDTNLITRADAEQLWQEHVSLFKRHVEEGKNPEMAIWIDMGTPDDFHTTAAHWRGEDFEIREGKMYSLEPVA